MNTVIWGIGVCLNRGNFLELGHWGTQVSQNRGNSQHPSSLAHHLLNLEKKGLYCLRELSPLA